MAVGNARVGAAASATLAAGSSARGRQAAMTQTAPTSGDPSPPCAHPTAVVEPSAQRDPGCTIGPFTVIGPRVHLHTHVHISAHCVIEGPTSIGAHSTVAPFASLGGAPQDRKYQGEPSRLDIGQRAVIREYVTINRGTGDQGRTLLGDDVMIMAYAHIAHDCQLGHRVTLANNTTLAGHVHLDDDVITGGMVAFHQHVRVGRLAFAAAGAMVERDVPPFCRVAGDRAKLVGLNLIGLRRHGLDRDRRQRLHQAYRALFRDDLALEQALTEVAQRWPNDPDVFAMLDFIRHSQRGLCR